MKKLVEQPEMEDDLWYFNEEIETDEQEEEEKEFVKKLFSEVKPEDI